MIYQFFKKNPFPSSVLIVFILLFFGCKNQPEQQDVAARTPATTDTLAVKSDIAATTPQNVAPIDAGSFLVKKLACGKSVKIKENGMEIKLLAQIEDKSKETANLPWLTFDGVAFEPGTSKLVMPNSVLQLSNLAQIMKCYPDTRLVIGINAAAGQKTLSQLDRERITVIKATLIGLEVPLANLQSENGGKDKNAAAGANGENKLAVKLMAK